jgi:hypothetical protein
LFLVAFEKDPSKGWFRTMKACQKACDVLNKADNDNYLLLNNGTVTVAHGWSLKDGHQPALPVTYAEYHTPIKDRIAALPKVTMTNLAGECI